MTPKDKPLTRREIEAMLAAWCEQADAHEKLKAEYAEAVDIIRDLRRKLACAGVEGSPPPWEADIPRLQRLLIEVIAERDRLIAMWPSTVRRCVWIDSEGNWRAGNDPERDYPTKEAAVMAIAEKEKAKAGEGD